jgi:phosphoadenosine phosphosulfate reductase
MTTPTTDAILLDELDAASQRFETAAPGEVVRWAMERFDGDVVYACSFQDIVLLDIAVGVAPQLEIIFLDTEAHFPETLAYRDAVAERYGLKLTITHPAAGAPTCGSEGCCAARKVAPLKEAVAGKAVWLTSLKRVDAPTRQAAPIVSWDAAFGLVKINPMATWTDEDIASYERSHELPIHPLIPQGYLSIGCAPTTRPVAAGEDPRAGRWFDSDKVECGLHES